MNNYNSVHIDVFCARLVSTHLASEEMPTDFDKDLVILVRCLVPRHDDLCAGEVLQFIHL